MKAKKIIKSLSFNIVALTSLVIVVFGYVMGYVGYLSFTDSLTEEYNSVSVNLAKTATQLFVDADSIDAYLDYGGAVNAYMDKDKGGDEGLNKYFSEHEEYADASLSAYVRALCVDYKKTFEDLTDFCNDMDVNVVYVIRPDEDNGFLTYRSVINAPSEKSGYSPWKVNHVAYTNDDYLSFYRDIFDGKLYEANVVRDKNLNEGLPHTTSVVPVVDSTGRVVAVTCVQTLMSELASGRRKYIIFVLIATVIIAAIAIFVFVTIMRRQVVAPLELVAIESERFAKENSPPERQLEIKRSYLNEIATLANSVNEMESATLKYIGNLSEIIGEKQRLSSELQVAGIIQESSIPTVFPPFPGKKEIDLYAKMIMAKQVGGDFYDFFLIDDEHIALVIADVSGKGIPASLFMMVNKIILKERALMGGDPATIMAFVNDRICENNKADLFVTVWFGVLELSTGRITAVNAGHEDPVVLRADGKTELFKTRHNLAIGVSPDAVYKNYELRLERGDKLFLYTDGIPDATDGVGNRLTVDKMLDILSESSDKGPYALIGDVIDKANAFVGDAPQFDDMTMLCMEYKGRSNARTMTVKATDDNLDNVTDFVNGILSEKGVGAKVVSQLDIALEEIFINVAHYAYNPDVGEVEISVEVTEGDIVLKFTDGGKRYDPLAKEDPDITLSAEDRQIGGLGIYMVKKLVDGISYEYVDGKNILILEKKF